MVAKSKRSTAIRDDSAGGRRQWAADRALRPAMRSPGRPVPSRAVQRAFWRLIAQGLSSEDAGAQVGVSMPVVSRWFRHAGGMNPISLSEPTGRYLSFSEREEIALLRVQDHGVREIARRIGRHRGELIAVVLQLDVELDDAAGQPNGLGACGRETYGFDAAPPSGDLADLDAGQRSACVDAEVVGSRECGERVDGA